MTSKSSLILHHIPTVYTFMQSGKLVVPAFQRKFVWPKSSTRDLLQSIYKGYPIGNILVLEDKPGVYPVLNNQKSLFPIIDQEKYNLHSKIWYVLDGSQRLAALYNIFFNNKADFEFWFDLETEEFIPGGDIQTKQSCISLRSLFSSDLFREVSTRIGKSGDSNLLLDRMNQLHSAFKDYELVIQILVGITLDDAVEVFERLNSKGISLSKDEIKRIRKKYPGRS